MADEKIHNPEPSTVPPQPAKVPQGPMNKPLLVGGVLLALLGLIAITELTRPRPNAASEKSAMRTKTESAPASTADITNFEHQTQQEAQELARIQAQKEALQRTLEAAQQGPVPILRMQTHLRVRMRIRSMHYSVSNSLPRQDTISPLRSRVPEVPRKRMPSSAEKRKRRRFTLQTSHWTSAARGTTRCRNSPRYQR